MHENDEAIEAWNTVLFDKFQRFRPLLDVGLGRHGTHALELISPTEGMHAVDLGCGFGETSFDIARRVGPTGSCVGVDAASRFVDSAAVEAKAIAAENVRFECHDVANDSLGGPYDYAFSRFGMMFFASPVAALRNVRASLKPGATFVSVVWRKKVDNDFLHAAEVEVEKILPAPPETNQVTCGPGPFSMASADVVTDVYRAAGFERVRLERLDLDVCIGRDMAEAIELGMALGPAGERIRLAGDLGVQKTPDVRKALERAYQPFIRPDGVFGPSSTWVIAAEAPGAGR